MGMKIIESFLFFFLPCLPNLFVIFFQIKFLMSQHRLKYKKIDEALRYQIIDRIVRKGEPLKSVADQTKINVSTCKAIVQVYQKEGRVGKKKNRNKIVDSIETFSFFVVENGVPKEILFKKFDNIKVTLNRDSTVEETMKENCQKKAQGMIEQVVQCYKSKRKEEMVKVEENQEVNQQQYMNYPFIQP